MPVYLLTGAGFSRNWGGWLANEVFEYLIGYPQITPELQRKLWHSKKAGFESVLNELRLAHQNRKDAASEADVKLFEQMLGDMFNAMNLGFKNIEFNPFLVKNQLGPQVDPIRRFLTHFDAIFTLNQDCLLELNYNSPGFHQSSEGRWRDFYCPGVVPLTLHGQEYMPPGLFKPGSKNFELEPHRQPYFKLHGSNNWRDDDSTILIMGGNKGPDIQNTHILRSYSAQFTHKIAQPNSKLVIIGYSFQDSHINEILEKAAQAGTKFFVIDNNGVDVLDSAANTPGSTQPYRHKIQDSISGASRRPLLTTLSTDQVEHGKIWRFINRLGPGS
jgi:hypothetical protein